jgi:hypothetical protein
MDGMSLSVFGQDGKFDNSRLFGKNGMILAHPGVVSGTKDLSPLSHDDASRIHGCSRPNLDS